MEVRTCSSRASNSFECVVGSESTGGLGCRGKSFFSFAVAEGAMRVASVTPTTSSTGISLFKAAFRCGHESTVGELEMRVCVHFHNKVRDSSLKLFVSKRKEAMEEPIPATNMLAATDISADAEKSTTGPLSNPTTGTLSGQGPLSNCSTVPTATTAQGTLASSGENDAPPEDETNHVPEVEQRHAESLGIGGPSNHVQVAEKHAVAIAEESTTEQFSDQANEEGNEKRLPDMTVATNLTNNNVITGKATGMQTYEFHEPTTPPAPPQCPTGLVGGFELTDGPQMQVATNNLTHTTTATLAHDTASNAAHNPPTVIHDVYLDAKLKYDLAKAQMKLKKKRRREESEHILRQKRLKEELEFVNNAVKKEREQIKIEFEKKQRAEKEAMAYSHVDVDQSIEVPGHHKHNVVEKWQRGHQKAALKAASERTVENATVATLPEAYQRLMTHGFAVVDNMTSLFHPDCRPSAEQRDFVHALPETYKEVIFEGSAFTDSKPDFEPVKDKLSSHARKQMVHKLPSKYAEYSEKYGPQAACIIEGYTTMPQDSTLPKQTVVQKNSQRNKRKKTQDESSNENDSEIAGTAIHDLAAHTDRMIGTEQKGMFAGAAGMAHNWTITTTTIVGGENYQHPHSDAGVPESFHRLQIFPFVCLHGFGLDTYSLWLLPDAMQTKYGFLHTFRKDQIIFMRGDFVHAGVPSKVPRGHIAFYPSVNAGWNR
jgi:hypothetical protein